MPFNGKKVAAMAKKKGIKAKDFVAYVYPDRSGNTSYADVEKNDNPKARTVELMADILQCPIDELFDREVEVSAGDNITADNNSTAFKGINTCDPRLLDIIQARDRQIDKAQQHLDKSQSQIDRLLAIVESRN